jgi:hypothetical protein
MTRKFNLAAVVPLVAALLIGCSSVGASPAPTNSPAPSAQPSPQPSPTQPPVSQVASAAQAAAVVFATEHIARMGPVMPDVIGQSAWYEASEDATGFTVKVTVGSGDCQAGCIETHTWTYHVDLDGTVALVADEGDDIGLPPATGTADPVTLNVALVAGPTCPVERNPPDPACAPRPVANTEIDVFDISGTMVASGVSGADGLATAQLPPGAYYVVVPAVPGLMGQAVPLAFAAVGGDNVRLTFMFDTGIR